MAFAALHRTAAAYYLRLHRYTPSSLNRHGPVQSSTAPEKIFRRQDKGGPAVSMPMNPRCWVQGNGLGQARGHHSFCPERPIRHLLCGRNRGSSIALLSHLPTADWLIFLHVTCHMSHVTCHLHLRRLRALKLLAVGCWLLVDLSAAGQGWACGLNAHEPEVLGSRQWAWPSQGTPQLLP